jgi:copper chaperone
MTRRVTLNVNGMTCGGCEHAVKRALTQLPGVEDVNASHKDALVEVAYDPDKAGPAQFTQKIEAIGYEVVK